jgi:uncharacterized protein
MQKPGTSIQANTIPDKVKHAVLGIEPEAQLVLFGSRARNFLFNIPVKKYADWDFLILTQKHAGPKTEAFFRDFLHDLELKSGEVISSLIFSEAAWKVHQNTPLYHNIQHEGIALDMSYQKEDLVKYRADRAKETLEEAKLMATNQHWNATVNRLYYACFYIVHALLLNEGHAAHTHSGTKAVFHQHFVRSGKVSPGLSRVFDELFSKRQIGDHGDMQSFDEKTVKALMPKAIQFVEAIEKLI